LAKIATFRCYFVATGVKKQGASSGLESRGCVSKAQGTALVQGALRPRGLRPPSCAVQKCDHTTAIY
jgi:hypothetical protein